MKLKYTVPALAAIAALTLTGCVDNTDGSEAKDSEAVAGVEVDEAAAAALPDDIKEKGTLVIGTDAAYPPNEYKDAAGDPVGWGVNLTDAVAAKLGLEPEWKVSKFDSIIPNINGGKYDMGSSSFTDTIERQKSVDFIDFYDAGSLWAQVAGGDVDPEDACGLKVAVQSGTIQDTDEMPVRNQKCEDEGKDPIDVQKFDAQEDVTNALVLGKVEAMSADSPVTLDAIAKTDGKIEQAGELFDAAPYGFVVEKDSELAEAVRLAVQSLIDDGTYDQILTDAGLDVGGVTEAKINSVTE
ncbi:MAG: ABC transporter substrate-binding protein [Canibacter sp.]